MCRTAFVSFFLLLVLYFPARGEQRDSLLNELNKAIANTWKYDAQKYERIAQLRSAINSEPHNNDPYLEFTLYSKLYDEYRIFRFDTAYIYAQKLFDIARSLNDPNKLVTSRIKLVFVLTSAGMYKEADEILKHINPAGQPDSVKAQYYTLKARFYYDLGDYLNDAFHTRLYYETANASLDTAVSLMPKNSFDNVYYKGLKNLKSGNIDTAYFCFTSLIEKEDLTNHQIALVASTLSYVYLVKGDTSSAIISQGRAAVSDILSSTKETFAIFNLAQLLFQQGNFALASDYIKKAVDDASFYGARQRKVQLSTIMPIIQSSEINFIKSQRRTWIIYGAIVSGILFLLTVLIIIIFRQNRKLENAKRVIVDAHNKLREANGLLQSVNKELQETNSKLKEVNSKLEEANKIKEEYIGYFFTMNSTFFQKMERLKKSLLQKLDDRKFDDIRYLVGSINMHTEKEELLKNFDKAFLKLFPHFVSEFNNLLIEGEQVKPEDHQLLNTDLRIYALIRLGIKENEKIAEILEYSIKSIYAYKTRIRNRARGPKEDFDRKVMAIASI